MSAVGASGAVERWRRSADTAGGRWSRVAVRGLGGAAVALLAAVLHDAHDPGVLCPLRRFTGIPCPGCGSTTVFIEAGHGSWAAALAANPVTVLVALGLLAAPLGPGRWWWRQSGRVRGGVIWGAAAASWAWQLHRYGFLPV
ncbi:DUF2752 domain-containing protein [Streptomyces sp. TLI_171]|uniref:DUF2752 domain-containing protein n=1 Tax=Streptomyces sp. TLI_171 TaxID=1938859 RepID=UPI000C18CDB0|nr:DUF2752 domain-containing protein [Streptomyces sp. TLI_171]RKE19466.1 uncharacterized protein DUF2752 [Streptomyces sp. TLI_171]